VVQVERGRPSVPAESPKDDWRKRGLLKRVQLTISACLGPCDAPNVVVIVTQTNTVWLGNISRRDQYQSLLDWASCSKLASSAALTRKPCWFPLAMIKARTPFRSRRDVIVSDSACLPAISKQKGLSRVSTATREATKSMQIRSCDRRAHRCDCAVTVIVICCRTREIYRDENRAGLWRPDDSQIVRCPSRS
jgi:hypothetical protein